MTTPSVRLTSQDRLERSLILEHRRSGSGHVAIVSRITDRARQAGQIIAEERPICPHAGSVLAREFCVSFAPGGRGCQIQPDWSRPAQTGDVSLVTDRKERRQRASPGRRPVSELWEDAAEQV